MGYLLRVRLFVERCCSPVTFCCKAIFSSVFPIAIIWYDSRLLDTSPSTLCFLRGFSILLVSMRLSSCVNSLFNLTFVSRFFCFYLPPHVSIVEKCSSNPFLPNGDWFLLTFEMIECSFSNGKCLKIKKLSRVTVVIFVVCTRPNHSEF